MVRKASIDDLILFAVCFSRIIPWAYGFYFILCLTLEKALFNLPTYNEYIK